MAKTKEKKPVDDKVLLEKLQKSKADVIEQLRKRITGQDEVVEQVLIALFAGGHCLITGVPGRLGK